jgi:mono/diheme cytochrome c family protein
MMTSTKSWRWVAGALAGAGLACAAGCRGDREDRPPREFFPDLDSQLKWRPQGRSEFFADGRMMRPAVPRTVPFGTMPRLPDGSWGSAWIEARADLLKEDALFYTGVSGRDDKGGPVYAERIPASVTVDQALLARGQDRFNIYCSACHGYLGDGRGTVGVQFSPAPADFNSAAFKDPKTVQFRDGYIFQTIRYGKLKDDGSGAHTMPPYGHAVNERDAWAIVAYVRALQAAHDGTIDDVPAALRGELEKSRGAAPASGGTP